MNGRLFLVLSLGAIAVACREAATPPPVLQTHSPADSADQFMVGMETKISDGGVHRANVVADSSFLYDNSARIEMYQVQFIFFTSTGVKEGIMTAHRSSYDTRVDSLQAWGDVKIVTTEGRNLATPYLRYNKVLNQISTDSIFTLTEPDRTITGIGFDSDPGLVAIRVHRLISGTAGTVLIPKR